MVKFLIIIGALFILYKLFANEARKKKATAATAKEQVRATGEMVKDPICGAFVPKDSDIRVREGEKVHCFCSFECRDKFIKQLTSQDSSSS